MSDEALLTLLSLAVLAGVGAVIILLDRKDPPR